MTIRERFHAVFQGRTPDVMAFYGDIALVKLVADLVEEHGRQ